MTTIQLYTGPAAAAAKRGLIWRRLALCGGPIDRVSRDAFEAANQFRLARYLAGGAR